MGSFKLLIITAHAVCSLRASHSRVSFGPALERELLSLCAVCGVILNVVKLSDLCLCTRFCPAVIFLAFRCAGDIFFLPVFFFLTLTFRLDGSLFYVIYLRFFY